MYETPHLHPDQLTLHLIASGLIKLIEKIQQGQPPRLPYPKELQRGLDRLVLNCLRQKKTPPQGIPDLLLWCQKPLTQWPLELPEVGESDQLLEAQIPSSLCLEWAVAGADIEAELTQKQLLLNAMQICKAAEAPDSYVAFRHLLISTPVVTEFERLKHFNNPPLERLEEQIYAAYEPAPEACAVEGNFYCCANCNNILLRTNGGNLTCGEESCRLAGLDKPGRKIAKKEGVYWLKRGLRRFIAAPGRAELRLAEKLNALNQLKTVELWPNGEAWAVDVKDWVNPFLLAQKVKQQNPPIPENPPWKEAYFVFPDERCQQRSDYLRAFTHHCPLPKFVKAKSESKLIKAVKTKLKKR